jgi:transposase-like protein
MFQIMKKYSDEFKNSIIARMLPPNNESVPQLARETGIPDNTLYYWRLRHGKQKNTATGKNGGHNSEDKFAIVLETAAMNEHELSVYCREKGLYPQQVRAWRKQCQQANEPGSDKVDKRELQKQSKQIKGLEKELQQKEKALAETAALLTLKKKVQQIWGDPEDEK